jgi:hypothetical protein
LDQIQDREHHAIGAKSVAPKLLLGDEVMGFPRVPYVADPEDRALLERANMFYEVAVLEAIGRAMNEAWDKRYPGWRTTGRRVPPYVAGDYRCAIVAVRETCAKAGSPLMAVPDAI